jgi:hypothetical protein
VTRRIDISSFLPLWRISEDLLSRSESLLIFGPRFSGKSTLLRALIRDMAPKLGRRAVVLELALAAHGSEIDYTFLFQAFIKNGGFSENASRRRLKVRGRDEFVDMVSDVIDREGGGIIIGVRLADQGIEAEQYDFLKSLHVLLGREYFDNKRRELSVVAVDSYSLWFHRRLLGLESELYCFHEEHWASLSTDEIKDCIMGAIVESKNSISERGVEALARRLRSVTGGHSGLLREAVEALDSVSWAPHASFWKDELLRRLGNGRVMQRLRHAFEEEPKGLVETAMEYERPAFPFELRSSRLRLLLQLGVLQWRSATEVELCGGVVGDLVKTLRVAAASGELDRLSRLGTVISESRPSIYEPSVWEPSDEDLVLVHLSDLHVSDRHAFRFAIRRGEFKNSDMPSIAELLTSDLERLGLLGRLDGLIVTGDFVWQGKDEEFRRVRLVLEDILSSLMLDRSKLLIIPGNHDLDWSPVGGLEASGRGDREAFIDFAERFGFDFREGSVWREFLSRSGTRLLRLIGLDSNYVEGQAAAGIGYVAKEALDRAGNWLKAVRKSNSQADEAVWLAVHHHIFPATSLRLGDAMQAKVSTMANSVEILARSSQWGVEAILHGHEHQPSLTVARRWPTDFRGKAFTPIVSIGAGSFGVEPALLGPFARHHYYVLGLRSQDILIRSRCLGDEGVAFVSHGDVLLPRKQ